MTHTLRSFFEEDRAVSPVIGVILMVAITVILAAVIGTFVIGIGDDIDTAPQAQINIDAPDNDTVEIDHAGGDSISNAELRVIVEGDDGESDEPDVFGEDGEFSVGTTESFDGGDVDESIEGNVTVTVIHEPSDSILRSVDFLDMDFSGD